MTSPSLAPSTGARFEQDLLVPWQQRLWRGIRGSAPIFLVLAGILVWISIRNPNFTDPPVFLAFLKRATPLMLLAAGQFFVIVSGEFDLSVGSLITAVVVIAARLIDSEPGRTWPVIGILIAFGAIVGLANGLLVTRLRVPSFIATLGMLLILEGGILYWTGGAPRGGLPENFRVYGRRGFEGVPVIEQLPYSVVALVIFGTLAVVLAGRTTFGKQLYAVGGNPRAAALSGVDVPLVRTLAFALSALGPWTCRRHHLLTQQPPQERESIDGNRVLGGRERTPN